METSLSGAILSVLLTIAPPDRLAKHRKDETAEEMRERYGDVAESVMQAVEQEKPLFGGKDGKLQTAALVLSIGFFESGFKKSVGSGKERGDGGRSWCFMQVQLGSGKFYAGTEEQKGWTGRDLVEDHVKCFRAGIRMLRLSMGSCSKYGGADKLSGYTSGTCKKNEPKARARWFYAAKVRQMLVTEKQKAEAQQAGEQ